MKQVFELDTPVGRYAVNYGHFMAMDKLGTKYHCWYNGGWLGGGEFTTLNTAKKHLIAVVKNNVIRSINGHNEQLYELNKLLRSLK